MNILFINEKCGFYGGVEQTVFDTARGLRKFGHRTYLGFTETTAKEPEKYTSSFVKTIHFSGQDFSADGCNSSKLSNLISDLDIDVVYLHKIPSVQFCLPHLEKVRFVRMVHDHDLCCPRRHKYFSGSGKVCTKKAGLRCWLDGAFIARDDSSPVGLKIVSIGDKINEMKSNHYLHSLVVGSNFMREELLVNGFSSDKCHIVPPAVISRVNKHTPPSLERNVLFVGQLIRGKGVDLLLHAASLLKGHFTLTIVGEGNARAKLEELALKKGLQDKVKFVGWVPNEKLTNYYKRARMFVLPSRWPEPFGMVGLEAMAHSRPVVAFNVGGISDWLVHKETGLLAKEQDVAQLAQHIDLLLSSPTLAAEMGKNGFTRLQTNYAFEENLRLLESLLLTDKSTFQIRRHGR